MALMVVRLLMPPGLCICQQTGGGAIRLLAPAGTEFPPEPEHDDHHPGCPASFLSLGLGVLPAGPGPLDLEAIVAPLSLLPSPTCDASAWTDLPAGHSGSTAQRPRHL